MGVSTQGDFNTANYTCLVSSAGNVWCWGDDSIGQLGDAAASVGGLATTGGSPGFAATSIIEVPAPGGGSSLKNIVQVATGPNHACALSSAGNVYCWGANDYGDLGNGSKTASAGGGAAIFTPVEVVGVGGTGFLSKIVSIAVSQYASCGLSSAGNVYCWGTNNGASFQLGNNLASGTFSYSPSEVVGPGGVGILSSIVSLSMTTHSACATSVTGSTYCWGNNASGELGNSLSPTLSQPSQTLAVGGSGYLSGAASSISSGLATFACALLNAGNVDCWGIANNGVLGSGTALAGAQLPVAVAGGEQGGASLSNVAALSVGQNSACAITSASGVYSVYCWGNDTGGNLLGTNSYDTNGSGSAHSSTYSWVPMQVCSSSAAGDQTTTCASFLRL